MNGFLEQALMRSTIDACPSDEHLKENYIPG